MNTTHGELALLAAIEAGQPTPTNQAQADELAAHEQQRRATQPQIPEPNTTRAA